MIRTSKGIKDEWREDDIGLLNCIENSLYYIDNTYKEIFIIEAYIMGILNKLRIYAEKKHVDIHFIAENLVDLEGNDLPKITNINEFGFIVRALLDDVKVKLEKHYKDVIVYGIKTPFYLGSKEISGLMCGDIVKQIQKADIIGAVSKMDGYIKELSEMNSKNIEKLKKIDDYLKNLSDSELKPDYLTSDIIDTILFIDDIQLKIKDIIYNNLIGNCLIEGQVESKT